MLSSLFLKPVKEEVVSPELYLEITSSRQVDNIKKVEFIPSRMNSKSFGKYKITYKNPKLMASSA